jgi:hypothetical protein
LDINWIGPNAIGYGLVTANIQSISNPIRALLSEQPHTTRPTHNSQHLDETCLITTTMGHKLSADILNHVIIHFEAGYTVPEVHEATKVSKSCLYKLWLSIDLWGTPYPPPTVKLGRPKTLSKEHELVIKVFYFYLNFN